MEKIQAEKSKISLLGKVAKGAGIASKAAKNVILGPILRNLSVYMLPTRFRQCKNRDNGLLYLHDLAYGLVKPKRYLTEMTGLKRSFVEGYREENDINYLSRGMGHLETLGLMIVQAKGYESLIHHMPADLEELAYFPAAFLLGNCLSYGYEKIRDKRRLNKIRAFDKGHPGFAEDVDFNLKKYASLGL